MDGAATAATTAGRSAAEGGHPGMHFPAGSGSAPSSGRIWGKVTNASAMFCSGFSARRIPATGEVQATVPALTSAETVPAVAASALLIHDADGTPLLGLCAGFTQALLSQSPADRTPHGRKAR